MRSNFSHIVKQLRNGAVGLLPSDTIYGLSCLALDQKAVERIYILKGRDYHKPLIILLADIDQAEQLGLRVSDLEPAQRYWPSPLTVIVPAGKLTPEFLHRGSRALAIRIPAKREVRELIKHTGPLISTSANPQGKRPARTAKEAKDYFGSELNFYIDTGRLKAKPSTIVELKGGELKLIRQGAFPALKILNKSSILNNDKGII
jgi:tRNA threonylcarbamoyl adenosine modification protein (Sua5/YciO/YrdC/YwlC family)